MADTLLDFPIGAAFPGGRPAAPRGRSPMTATERTSGAAGRRRVERARATVILCGIPEPVVQRVEREGHVDWRSLAGELDGLSIATGGQHAVRAFWQTPHRELAGRTPLDALDSPAAARVLADLVRARATAVGRARFGVSV